MPTKRVLAPQVSQAGEFSKCSRWVSSATTLMRRARQTFTGLLLCERRACLWLGGDGDQCGGGAGGEGADGALEQAFVCLIGCQTSSMSQEACVDRRASRG